MVLEIPNRLNGNSFYGEILPSIYNRIIQGDCLIDFDMHRTELANPEGLVNLLAAAAMIRRKSGYIPQVLYLPEKPNLVEYMRKSGFFRWATVPGCESLRFDGFMDAAFFDEQRRGNFFRPQLYGLFTHSNEGTTFNRHIRHIEEFVLQTADSLAEDKVDSFEISRYCRTLSLSLVQVVKNSLEHNHGYRGTLAYYMMQKTPYHTIEFAFSDIGQGFLERMKEMLKKKDPEAVAKYGCLESKLNSKDLLYKDNNENPNLLAITHAVKYREESEIPGLHKIKEFVLKYNGRFSIHSGNYSVNYELTKAKEPSIRPFYHDSSYFSGCHLKIVFSLPQPSKDI
jgi:hypothetical protein